MPLLHGTVSKKGANFPHTWQSRYCVVFEEVSSLPEQASPHSV